MIDSGNRFKYSPANKVLAVVIDSGVYRHSYNTFFYSKPNVPLKSVNVINME